MDNKVQEVPTIKEQWVSFIEVIFGNLMPSDVQYTEMQKAFYADSAVVLHNLGMISKLDEEKGVEVLQAMHQECIRFVDSLRSKC